MIRIRESAQRRSCPRLSTSFRVLIHATKLHHDGIVTDLGIGGLFVRTDLGLVPGMRVSILVEHGGQVVRWPAVVRWVDGEGFGAQFEPFGALENRVLHELISCARNG